MWLQVGNSRSFFRIDNRERIANRKKTNIYFGLTTASGLPTEKPRTSNLKNMLSLYPTDEGTFTLYHEGTEDIYHSRRGVLQESQHVFIETGLQYAFEKKKNLNILEIGFGTGLNALTTLAYMSQMPTQLAYYCGLEVLEIPSELWQALAYPAQMDRADLTAYFEQMHITEWGQTQTLLPNFRFKKELKSVFDYTADVPFDVVYFDAFSPNKQAEMWEAGIFERLYAMMSAGGILVTYSAKGQVRRNMQSVGFITERLPGPARKHEMLRATKP